MSGLWPLAVPPRSGEDSDSRSSIGFEVRDAGEDPGDLPGTPEKVDNAKGSSPPC